MNPADADARRAWQLLVKFFFAQREHLPASGEEFDLSPVQCHVLHLIEPDRPLPMRRLARTLSCDASNVTGLIDRLEDRGYIRRRSSPHDRRVKVLELTPMGCRRREQLVKHLQSAIVPLARLSASDQRKLVELLESILESEHDPD